MRQQMRISEVKVFRIQRLTWHNRQQTAKSFPEPLSTPQTLSTLHNIEME